MSVPAFPHQIPETPIAVDDQEVEYNLATICHNAPFALTGHPVMTLPVGSSREGLPIGVQVVGRRWGEMPLLAVAKQIVRVTGPYRFPPGY
jgi:amidase